MCDETKEMLKKILNERVDNALNKGNTDVLLAWSTAKSIVEYALADNVECLQEFKY